jgi:hypothetical protein
MCRHRPAKSLRGHLVVLIDFDEGGFTVIRWTPIFRIALVLGAIGSFVLASGAGTRWNW